MTISKIFELFKIEEECSPYFDALSQPICKLGSSLIAENAQRFPALLTLRIFRLLWSLSALRFRDGSGNGPPRKAPTSVKESCTFDIAAPVKWTPYFTGQAKITKTDIQ